MALNEAVSGPNSFRNRFQFKHRKQRTYILPTGFGYAFAITALILFFMAVGYANNLIYIFVFLLISTAVTGMVITNRNIDACEINVDAPKSVFADERSVVHVQVINKRNYAIWSLQLSFLRESDAADVPQLVERERKVVEVPFYPKTRGRYKLPVLKIQSVFPFELMRAWKSFSTSSEVLVYPAKKGHRNFPLDSFDGQSLQSTGLFRDHRLFQSADSMMRIDWRASARRQELLVKNFETGDRPILHFHWDQTAHWEEKEQRLSQLCLWIDEAERLGREYSLEISTFKSSYSRGPQHRHQCLEVLALINVETLS